MCNAIKNALYKRFNICGNKRAANNINNAYKLILTALYYILTYKLNYLYSKIYNHHISCVIFYMPLFLPYIER